MGDEDIKSYFPSFGDRLAIRDYCTQSGSSASAKTCSLIERIKKKVTTRLQEPSNISSAKGFQGKLISGSTANLKCPAKGSHNAVKATRLVHFSWLHMIRGQYKQQRGINAGKKAATVPKSSTKCDLINIAKSIFFPKGASAFGKVADMRFDLYDTCRPTSNTIPLPDNFILGNYIKTGETRLYLYSRKRKGFLKVDSEVEFNVSSVEETTSTESEEGKYKTQIYVRACY